MNGFQLCVDGSNTVLEIVFNNYAVALFYGLALFRNTLSEALYMVSI